MPETLLYMAAAYGAAEALSPKPGVPTPPPPARMPTTADQKNARKSSIREQLMRQGRASTILTGNPDGLGG